MWFDDSLFAQEDRGVVEVRIRTRLCSNGQRGSSGYASVNVYGAGLSLR